MFYKFLEKTLTHHGFTYRLGMNEDIHPLNEDVTKDYVKGGLYFIDKENITEFYGNFGPYLGIIELPEGEKVIKVGNKYRAQRIILKEIITDDKEIMKYLDMNKIKNCYKAAVYGHLEILKHLHASGRLCGQMNCTCGRWAFWTSQIH